MTENLDLEINKQTFFILDKTAREVLKFLNEQFVLIENQEREANPQLSNSTLNIVIAQKLGDAFNLKYPNCSLEVAEAMELLKQHNFLVYQKYQSDPSRCYIGQKGIRIQTVGRKYEDNLRKLVQTERTAKKDQKTRDYFSRILGIAAIIISVLGVYISWKYK